MAQKKITDLSLRSDFDTTCNIPVDDALQTYRVTGSQVLSFLKSLTSRSDEITNLSLVTSVGSSALTISVKTQAGANPSSTDPINVAMRSSALTSGAYTNRALTSALSMVVSSGSTLGQVSAQPSFIYVYLIDNAGTLELAVSHALYPEDALVTTVAEGGAGAADSATVIYSSTARSLVPARLIGYILNTQTTAGTWASAGTQVELLPKNTRKPPVVQTFTSGSGNCYTPPGALYLKFRAIGAGGNGGGSGVAGTGVAGGAGGNTTFGTSTAAGGAGGYQSNQGGSNPAGGGAATLGAGILGTAIVGGNSNGETYMGGTWAFPGSNGGNAPFFGGAGYGGWGAGNAGVANTGGGGSSGGLSVTGTYSGTGGGSGGFVEGIITNPAASYSYAIGAASATVGTAGTSGFAGGLGGGGYLEVIAYFQ